MYQQEATRKLPKVMMAEIEDILKFGVEDIGPPKTRKKRKDAGKKKVKK